ncbi:MAG TPA: TonB-dependent receptor, partial [Terriglobales bacterium]|nr:TonB-dependent receptor [Terriglobales bacterium]
MAGFFTFERSWRISLLLFVALTATSAFTQTTFGSFQGIVSDSSGAVVPNAAVSILNKETGVVRQSTTGDQGFYKVNGLNPGVYTVSVQVAGFAKQVTQEITLQVDQTVEQDFRLQLGETSQTVEVSSTSATIQTSETTVGTVITNRETVDLPLNGRSFIDLINLSPGSYARTKDQSNSFRVGRTSMASPAINGTRGQDNNYTIDGIENNELSWNFYAMTPSVDAIQEFKVQTGTSSGQFGRAAGANINVAIKSGTNAYHGDVYEFLRNDVFDARGYFAPSKTPLRMNQFGATLGGPIYKNKTFFFGAYEGLRVSQANTLVATVPLQSELQGDFSGQAPIYDPLTTCGQGSNPACAVDGSGNPIETRQQFPNNIIPADRINAASAAYSALWPAPNAAGLSGNLINNLPNTESGNQFNGRVDHSFSDRMNIFSRVSYDHVATTGATEFPNVKSSRDRTSINGVFSFNYTFSSVSNIDVKLGYNRNELPSFQPLTGVTRSDFLTQTGIQGLATTLPANVLPGLGIPGFDYVSGDYTITGPHTTWQGKVDYLHIFGRHSFTAGLDIRKNHVRYFPDDGSRGEFDFDSRTTADLTNPDGTGSALASFLLGYPSFDARIVGSTQSNLLNWNYDFYLGDDWKVTPKLTVNLGIRYEYNQWPIESTRQQSDLDIFRDPQTGQLAAQLLHSLPNPYPSPNTGEFEPANARPGIMDPDWNNFAPRVGISYMLTPKTVVRSGYSIFYTSTYFQQSEDLRENFPLLAQQRSSQDTTYPDATFQTAFPADAGTQNEFGGWPQNKRNRNSYSQQWNLAVERQLLEDTVLSATYVGQKGTKLIIYTDINNATPGPGPLDDRRPITHTTDGFLVGDLNAGENVGESAYNALQLKLTRRFSKGLSLLSSYTWGRSMDIQSSLFDDTQVQ